MLRLFATVCVLAFATVGNSFEIICWNVESGGTDPGRIARELTELPKADVYLLQEVDPNDIGRYAASIRKAFGPNYKYHLGSTGRSDRLAVILDESKLRVLAFTELFGHKDLQLNDWNHRSPLVSRVRIEESGEELLLVTVHLARGNAKLRNEQAEGLREWASAQSLPVVLAGDCNFDYHFRSKKGNAAHRAFFQGDIFRELEPKKRIDTNWSDNDGDGKDNYPGSALDFAAVCPNGKQIDGECRVIVRAGDFPDDDTTSDHRPIWVTIEF